MKFEDKADTFLWILGMACWVSAIVVSPRPWNYVMAAVLFIYLAGRGRRA